MVINNENINHERIHQSIDALIAFVYVLRGALSGQQQHF